MNLIQALNDNLTKEAIIRKKGNEWCVYSESGKNMGCFESQEKAKKRIGQIEFFKHQSQYVRKTSPNIAKGEIEILKLLSNAIYGLTKDAIQFALSEVDEVNQELENLELKGIIQKDEEDKYRLTELGSRIMSKRAQVSNDSEYESLLKTVTERESPKLKDVTTTNSESESNKDLNSYVGKNYSERAIGEKSKTWKITNVITEEAGTFFETKPVQVISGEEQVMNRIHYKDANDFLNAIEEGRIKVLSMKTKIIKEEDLLESLANSISERKLAQIGHDKYEDVEDVILEILRKAEDVPLNMFDLVSVTDLSEEDILQALDSLIEQELVKEEENGAGWYLSSKGMNNKEVQSIYKRKSLVKNSQSETNETDVSLDDKFSEGELFVCKKEYSPDEELLPGGFVEGSHIQIIRILDKDNDSYLIRPIGNGLVRLVLSKSDIEKNFDRITHGSLSGVEDDEDIEYGVEHERFAK